MQLSERLFWIGRGYRFVTYLELCCICGVFRAEFSEPLTNYPCPQCGRSADIRILGTGVSKRDTLPGWEQVAPSFRLRAHNARAFDDTYHYTSPLVLRSP